MTATTGLQAGLRPGPGRAKGHGLARAPSIGTRTYPDPPGGHRPTDRVDGGTGLMAGLMAAEGRPLTPRIQPRCASKAITAITRPREIQIKTRRYGPSARAPAP